MLSRVFCSTLSTLSFALMATEDARHTLPKFLCMISSAVGGVPADVWYRLGSRSRPGSSQGPSHRMDSRRAHHRWMVATPATAHIILSLFALPAANNTHLDSLPLRMCKTRSHRLLGLLPPRMLFGLAMVLSARQLKAGAPFTTMLYRGSGI